MKYLVLFLKFILLCTLVNAQSLGVNYGFDEEFENDKHHKFGYHSSVFNSTVHNGLAAMVHNLDNESFYLSHFAYINPVNPYVISSSFKFNSGKISTGYGILFGAKGIKDAYIFEISANGYYQLFKYVNGEPEIIKKWTQPDSVKIGKAFNKLDIKHTGGVLEFYINSKKVYETKTLPFFGFDFGYFFSGEVSVSSEYFRVKQEQTQKINLIENADGYGIKKSIGAGINSYADEYTPVISADEKVIYFARKNHKLNTEDISTQDIWYSEFNTKDSIWKEAINVGKPLNNASNNYVVAVSPDKNNLVIGNHYTSNGKYNGKGYSITHKTGNGWSMPKDMNIINYYNRSQHTEIALSSNGKVMLLSAQRDETHGSRDLYVSFLQPDSSWSEPSNIGTSINTFADEVTPFIAADGVTLYFSSAGYPGYGDNDIFITKRLDESWKKWSVPKNLGPKINTNVWDAYFCVPASGKHAYLVSDNKDENLDLYVLKQPESAKPEPVLLVKGVVYNSETKQPMEAMIQYAELGSKKILGHAKSDPSTGIFVLTLPKGKQYSVVADKAHFISVHENTDIVSLKNYSEKIIDLYLTPIKKGQSVIINNLFFVANKTDILPESYPELDKLAELLIANHRLKIVVMGHTSKNNSSEERNKILSTNRALAVRNYLVAKGIAEERITYKGYGNERPVDKGTDEQSLARNRRVEFEILED